MQRAVKTIRTVPQRLQRLSAEKDEYKLTKHTNLISNTCLQCELSLREWGCEYFVICGLIICILRSDDATSCKNHSNSTATTSMMLKDCQRKKMNIKQPNVPHFILNTCHTLVLVTLLSIRAHLAYVHKFASLLSVSIWCSLFSTVINLYY